MVCWLHLLLHLLPSLLLHLLLRLLLSLLLCPQQLLLLGLLWQFWPLLAEGHLHQLQSFGLTAAGVWQSVES